ncbi:MAG: hypothetical protein PUC46_03740 [Lachnospiraceae bacterium]|nr:hypothetical protein [Lachnospiraceae bacterium]
MKKMMNACKRIPGPLLIIEAALILLSLIWIALPLSQYTCKGADLVSQMGSYQQNFMGNKGEGYYLDNTMTPDEDGKIEAATAPINLHPGSYRITLMYSADHHDNTYTASAAFDTYSVVTGHSQKGLPEGENQTQFFRMDTAAPVQDYSIAFDYSGNGYLFVNGITVQETRQMRGEVFVLLVLGSIALNAFLLLWNPQSALAAGTKALLSRRFILVGLIALVVFSSLPLFSYYLLNGHDLQFHLQRIEGLAQAIETGRLPDRVCAYWCNGYGYAVGTFYGELLLTFPALLRIFGFSVQNAYKMYVLVINLVTCALSWYSFRKILRTRRAAMLATSVYMLAPIRLTNIYVRGAVGEYTSMAFMPLILYGVYRLYTYENNCGRQGLLSAFREYLSMSWPILLGYSLVIESHSLSTLLIAVFVVIAGLFMWKKTFRPKYLKRILFCAVMLFGINLCYLLPMLDGFRTPFEAMDLDAMGRFGANGVNLWQLLGLMPLGYGSSYAVYEELEGVEMPYAIGLALIAGLLVYVVLRSVLPGRRGLQADVRTNLRCADVCAWVGAIALFMSTIWFPWDLLQQTGSLIAFLTKNIQFPWRFLSGASILLALVCGAAYLLLRGGGEELRGRSGPFAAAVLGLSVVTAGYFLSTACENTSNWSLATVRGDLNSSNVMGGEFLPRGADRTMFNDVQPIAGDGVTVGDFSRENGTVQMTVSNSSDQQSYVDLPLLFYRGYVAKDAQSTETLGVTDGTGERVRVVLPAGYSGTVTASYTEKPAWIAADLVSAAFLVLIAAAEIVPAERNRKKR